MFNFAFDYKNTNQLKDGDVILAHGCYFRLRDGQSRDYYPGEQRYCETGVSWFKTDLLGYSKHCKLTNWIIQGNDNATWAVVQPALSPDDA